MPPALSRLKRQWKNSDERSNCVLAASMMAALASLPDLVVCRFSPLFLFYFSPFLLFSSFFFPFFMMWWRRIIGGHCCLAPLLLLRPLSTLSPPSIVPTLLHPSHRGWMCGAFGICAVRSGGRSNVPYGGRSGVGERTAGGWRSRVSTCPTIGLSYLPGQRRPGPL